VEAWLELKDLGELSAAVKSRLRSVRLAKEKLSTLCPATRRTNPRPQKKLSGPPFAAGNVQ
jgi:hypothetical protein